MTQGPLVATATCFVLLEMLALGGLLSQSSWIVRFASSHIESDQRMPSSTSSSHKFSTALLHWYDANKRQLPWRKTRSPYRIWVSEIMLQQTRVAAVVEYYKRFLSEFPSVRALARASEQQVLAQWSGLGYYRRARMLHAAAKQLATERLRIPRTSTELHALPGIGRYTAAAIASIAFDEPIAVVDGNVERVLQRMEGRAVNDPWAAAQSLLDPARPGDFNQAMMELGATVCLPKNPACSACPVSSWCKLRGEHETDKKEVRRQAAIGYRLHFENGKVTLIQRPKNARLMPGMWELPQMERESPRTKPLLALKHSITTTDYSVRVWRARTPARDGSVQLSLAKASKLPLTGLTRKILNRLDLLKSR